MLAYSSASCAAACPADEGLNAAGALVFEEDTMGEAMYVVLSGQCEIRARPTHAASIPQQHSQPVSNVRVRPRRRKAVSDSDTDSSEGKEEISPRAAPQATRSEAEHSASFWIRKYMQQVC